MGLAILRKKWLAPLIFFELYLTVTLLFFFFGPWPWKIGSPVQLATYLVAAQVFIGSGYLLAWRRVRRTHGAGLSAVQAPQVVAGIVFLKRALIVTFILMIPTSLSRTGGVFPDIFAGLGDAGAVYNQNFERLASGNAFVIVEYLRMLLSPLLVGVYPLAIVYWSRLSGGLRILCLTGIIFNLSLYLATGTNKGLADFVITLPWLMFLGISAGVLKLRIHRGILVIGLTVLFIAFLQFFGMGQIQREGGVGESGVFNTGFGILQVDRSSATSQLLSSDLRIIFESLTRYIGQGYYALSMSFGIDHSSTLGFGNSMFLARNADAIFGTSYFTRGSIPGLLEAKTGWGMFTLWHSIYPWLASDFGFVGALFVLAALSYLFALSWGRSLVTLAPQWVVLSYLLFILFFYIPANNQIFQSGETCFAFLLLLLAIMRRKKSRLTVLSPSHHQSMLQSNKFKSIKPVWPVAMSEKYSDARHVVSGKNVNI